MSKVPTFEDADDGCEYRLRQGLVEARSRGSRQWEAVSGQSLLRFEKDSPLWKWLREKGVTRPSPSGRTAEDDRSTLQVKLRLDPEAAAALEMLAKELNKTKSELVASWALRAETQFHENAKALQKRRHDEAEAERQDRRARGLPVEPDIIGDHNRLLEKRAKEKGRE